MLAPPRKSFDAPDLQTMTDNQSPLLPNVTREVLKNHPNVRLLRNTAGVRGMMTVIRDRTTSRADFVFQCDRLIRLLIEEALNHVKHNPKEITTPLGDVYKGIDFSTRICGVPIVRAGESMEKGFREVCCGARIGKLLIQRDEKTLQPKLLYTKFPHDIARRAVFLMDCMVATAGSACKAVETLIDHGVAEENIIFVNLVCCPEGVEALCGRFKKMQFVTAAVDEKLDEKGYIRPGIGDFGDRYFGTEAMVLAPRSSSMWKSSHDQTEMLKSLSPPKVSSVPEGE